MILLYGHLVYFIWHEKFAIWNEDMPKKVMIKSQRQFMYGSNFYESDVSLNWISIVEKQLTVLKCIYCDSSADIYNAL